MIRGRVNAFSQGGRLMTIGLGSMEEPHRRLPSFPQQPTMVVEVGLVAAVVGDEFFPRHAGHRIEHAGVGYAPAFELALDHVGPLPGKGVGHRCAPP